MGGATTKPSYEDVCSGRTGHSEVVQIEFDPQRVSYDKLLDVFWKTHNPCSSNKAQYKSVIFYHSEQQQATARDAKERLAKSNGYHGVVTDLVSAGKFWRAEEYHQQFYEKSGQGRARAGVGTL